MIQLRPSARGTGEPQVELPLFLGLLRVLGAQPGDPGESGPGFDLRETGDAAVLAQLPNNPSVQRALGHLCSLEAQHSEILEGPAMKPTRGFWGHKGPPQRPHSALPCLGFTRPPAADTRVYPGR